MPVYIGIVLKILSDFDLILTEHCFPKIIYIHIGQMFLRKFRFVKFMIAHTTPSFNKRFLHETICAALCVGIRHSAIRLAASCLRCICG